MSDIIPVSKDRIWIDGCFDFGHHGINFVRRIDIIGHAGAILQAKRMGKHLVVGVHSDEEITINKGPPVMSLEERYQFYNSLVDSGMPLLRHVNGLIKSCLMPRMSQRNHGSTSMDVNMLSMGMIFRLMLMDEIVMKESRKQVDS